MKKLSKNLSKRVKKTLEKDANFKDVYQKVCNRAKSKPYLVGGKLYRTLVEIIYDYPARSHSCDFDFAAVEVIKKKKKKVRRKRRKPIVNFDGTTNFILSSTVFAPGPERPYMHGDSIKMYTDSGCKIDLISIPDLRAIALGELPKSIEGYLKSVPLSIQSIAMDLDRCEIFGKVGLDSINEKFVWINNKASLDNYIKARGGTYDSYIRSKADSIKFHHDAIKVPKKNNTYRKFKKDALAINTVAGMWNQAWNQADVLVTNDGGQIQWQSPIVAHEWPLHPPAPTPEITLDPAPAPTPPPPGGGTPYSVSGELYVNINDGDIWRYSEAAGEWLYEMTLP